MRVIAIKKGFYSGGRRRPGDVFEMSEADMKALDGKPVLPGWVVEAKDPAAAREQVAKAKRLEERKHSDAAVAASGGAAARRKVDRAGETDDLV